MEEQESQVIEVVGYGDVRDVAQDAAEQAASTVLMDAQERTADDLHDVAKDAADSAAHQVAQEQHETLVEDAEMIAQEAASGAVQDVKEALDAQLEQMEARSTEVTTVTLASEQYEYLQRQLMVGTYVSLLTIVLVASLFGVLVWRTIVGGR